MAVLRKGSMLDTSSATSRDDAIFLARKFISRAEEPLGTFPYQTSSRRGRNPSAYWPENFFLANQRVASHADVLGHSFPPPRKSADSNSHFRGRKQTFVGEETSDETLRTSAWEVNQRGSLAG